MPDLVSLIFYLTCFLVAGYLIHIGNKNSNRLTTALGLAIPIMVGGFRYMVGSDYGTYTKNMEWLKGVDIPTYIDRFLSFLEPMFYLFSQLSHTFNNPHLVFILYSAVTILFIYKAIKLSKTKHVALVFTLFLLIMFPISFNLMRQLAAVSVAAYAIANLYRNRTGVSIAALIFASLFHLSALVGLVAIPINYYIRSRRNGGSIERNVAHRALITVAVVATPILIWFAAYKYGYLFDYDKTTENLNFIPKLLFLTIIITAARMHGKFYDKYKLFIILGVICVALSSLGFFIQYADRVSLYFMPFLIILLPQAISLLLAKRGIDSKMTTWFIVALGVGYFTASYVVLGSHSVVPYHHIFNKGAYGFISGDAAQG